MKLFLTLSIFCLAHSAFANLCTRYENSVEKLKALEVAAKESKTTSEELCRSQQILDIEIAPSQVINANGVIVPQMKVTFHYDYQSCQYMIDRKALTLTSNYCYDTW